MTDLRNELEATMRRVGAILGATIDGEAIPACAHLADPERSGGVYLDAEDAYVACSVCTGARMVGGPELHCGVCGISDKASDWTLNPIPVHILLGAPLLLELPDGEPIMFLSREFLAMPTLATCRRDRGLIDDGNIELHWSPRVLEDNNDMEV
jgi:hypothetical protein